VRRRDFLRLCGAGAAAAQAGAFAAEGRTRLYARARLVDEAGAPLRARSLRPNLNYVFHYPYASTPCFLLNLGRAANPVGEWKGGVGPQRSVVAYSAICAHKLTYPTREISFISYRAEKTPGNRVGAVIHCCSEHSQYDPAAGARVVAGPAPQALAAILLEWDPASDELHALGTQGGEMFGEFFAKYEFKLATEYGGAARQTVRDKCVVTELENYCRQQVKC
jgi:Rieske Fe-S protein